VPARKRDELFDALVAAWGVDPAELTDSARGALNRALKELRAVEATPAEVTVRVERYRRRHPKWEFTPTALAKFWASLSADSDNPDAITRAYLAAKKAGL
jgi:hypothetical protein